MISKKDRQFGRWGFFFLLLFITFHPALLNFLFSYSLGKEGFEQLLILAAGTPVLLAGLTMAGRYLTRREMIQFGPSPDPAHWPLAIMKGVSVIFGMTALGYIALDLGFNEIPPTRALASSLMSSVHLGWAGPMYIIGMIVASITYAELFFRGYWLRFFSKNLAFPFALFLSAVVYSVGHLPNSLALAVLLFFSGLGYGLVANAYGLPIAFFSHALFDTMVIVRTRVGEDLTIHFIKNYLLFFVAFFFAGVCLFLVDMLWKRLSERKSERYLFDQP